MDEPIISAEHLRKTFILRQNSYGGLKGTLLHFNQYIYNVINAEEFVALDNLTFRIYQGETVALVGHNGSGKTTLLSIIGGVIKLFSGKLTVRGKVCMLLALGAGFVPELSGRENIILNGVLQGKTKKEMLALVDEITEFAGLEHFIDMPLFQYSSGMQMRLGFAVSTVIDPEILLIDEVLAVGDSDFAKKCEKRINQLLSKNVTLILVSHNPADVIKYCKRVIHLDHGQIKYDGPTDIYYQKIESLNN